MKQKNIRLFVWEGVAVLCLVVLSRCRRSGEDGRAAPETAPPWTLSLAAPIDILEESPQIRPCAL